mmetsp:Transcript_42085/g.103764  ORF Transcript_42085/g.103764 Transcript_42085/m.103764 type:complete len:202 (-) Transcript_42085:1507-2112(-)
MSPRSSPPVNSTSSRSPLWPSSSKSWPAPALSPTMSVEPVSAITAGASAGGWGMAEQPLPGGHASQPAEARTCAARVPGCRHTWDEHLPVSAAGHSEQMRVSWYAWRHLAHTLTQPPAHAPAWHPPLPCRKSRHVPQYCTVGGRPPARVVAATAPRLRSSSVRSSKVAAIERGPLSTRIRMLPQTSGSESSILPMTVSRLA